MSGVTKALGKVFKKVVPGLKKVLPAGLALGALVFTAGAALGALPTWGSAISQTAARLGLGEGLTNILSGAVTQAGYGAALGAAGAAITGGKVDKGALLGAVTGAITGGVTGGLGMQTDPLKGLGEQTDPMKATAAPGVDAAGSGVEQSSPYSPENGDGLTGTGIDSDMSVGGGAASPRRGLMMDDLTSDVPGATKATPTGTTTEPKGWLERHQTLAGSALSGAGRAAATVIAGGAEASAAQKAREQRAANYRSGTRGLMLDEPADPTNARAPVPTPTGPAPRAPQTVGGYRYDKTKGSVDWVNEGAG